MKRATSRRTFVKATAAAGAGYWALGGVSPKPSHAANGRIQFACIGVAGKGSSDSADAGQAGDVVGICDIDEDKLKTASEKFPNAAKYYDYREMLEELGDKVDAVTVSTPDHTHAVAAAAAMKSGKHCFCQKPLTQSIWEARQLGDIAREAGVQTQMGNQGTAEAGLREAAALLKAGAIGDIKEVHVWTNRPVWPQGIDQPEGQEPPPEVHWKEWISRAEMRPYSPAYHPFKWRGFWDFGTGALGDMACHTLNMPYMGADLKDPSSVQAITSGHNKISFPSWSEITFEFPANDWRGPVVLKWYDGGKMPAAELLEGRTPSKSGCLVVGTNGKIFSPNDYGAEFELIGGEQKDVEYQRSPGHFREFAMAIQTGKPATSNFPDYAGPLTETILLGNLAVWAADQPEQQGEKIAWDAKNLKVQGTDKYDGIVKPEFHNGYSL